MRSRVIARQSAYATIGMFGAEKVRSHARVFPVMRIAMNLAPATISGQSKLSRALWYVMQLRNFWCVTASDATTQLCSVTLFEPVVVLGADKRVRRRRSANQRNRWTGTHPEP